MKIFHSGICSLLLTACTTIYTDASDANQVTFLNASGESMAQLTKKANMYCAQYGKAAVYKSSDSFIAIVFTCNPER